MPQDVIGGEYDERFCDSPGRLHPVTSDDLAVTALPILLYGGRLRPPRRLTFARAELPSMNQRNDQHERFAVPLRKTVRVFCAGHRMLLPMQNRLLNPQAVSHWRGLPCRWLDGWDRRADVRRIAPGYRRRRMQPEWYGQLTCPP